MKEGRYGSTPGTRRSHLMLLDCSSQLLVMLLREHGSTAGTNVIKTKGC